MLRFSLAGLFVVVVFAALGCAALLGSSPLWGSVLLSATFLAVPLAVLAAVYGRGGRRAFWAGFALLAGGYLFLIFGPWFEDQRSNFVTSQLLLRLQEVVPAPAADDAQLKAAEAELAGAKDDLKRMQALINARLIGSARLPEAQLRVQHATAAVEDLKLRGFHGSGHCLWALLLGALGAALAGWFWKRRAEGATPASA